MHVAAATAVLLSATAAQAGDVEWTRRRGGGGAPVPLRGRLAAFAGGARAGGRLEATSLRRPRSRSSQVVSMQLSDVSVAAAGESMDYRRRSVTRNLFSENSREVSGWMATLRNFDGPEMPFDEMLDRWDEADRMMNVSLKQRQKKWSRNHKHFELRRNLTLLTRTEEIELGRKVQELLRWERVRSFLEMRLGRPATMEEWAVELAALDGVEGLKREIEAMQAARDRMISCNLRLVLYIAKRKFFTSSGTLKVSLEDMIQDGTAGLVKAVERFDPEKGFRFSTYATWWVHQGIHCGFADCGRVIRLPMNLHSQVSKVVRLQATMVDQLGREPTFGELVLESGLSQRMVEKCLRVSKVEPISLDKLRPSKGEHLPFGKGERVGDNVVSIQDKEPVHGADVTLLKGDVATILGDLSPREAFVLRMRFGLGGSTPSTLACIGRRLNLTRERVRQIQVAAIEKLRGRSPSHEALYSDRAVACGKEFGGMPSAALIDLVRKALEPREDGMLDGDGDGDGEGRAVTGARRRRLLRQSARMERVAAAAAAATLSGEGGAPSAAAAAAAAVAAAAAAGNGTKKTMRGFVVKRPYSKRLRTRTGANGEGAAATGDAAGTVTGTGTPPAPPPPVQQTAAWEPSLQAA